MISNVFCDDISDLELIQISILVKFVPLDMIVAVLIEKIGIVLVSIDDHLLNNSTLKPGLVFFALIQHWLK